MPTYAAPRKVEIVLTDDDGTKRLATATRAYGSANLPRWELTLQHPSGHAWPASFNGANILDALGELVERKEHAYNAERSRGHRVSQMMPDRNVPIRDDGSFTRADLMTTNGKQVAFGRAAAAAARSRTGSE